MTTLTRMIPGPYHQVERKTGFHPLPLAWALAKKAADDAIPAPPALHDITIDADHNSIGQMWKVRDVLNYMYQFRSFRVRPCVQRRRFLKRVLSEWSFDRSDTTLTPMEPMGHNSDTTLTLMTPQ